MIIKLHCTIATLNFDLNECFNPSQVKKFAILTGARI